MRINKYVGMAMGTFALTAGILAAPLFAEDQSANKFDAAIRMAMASSNGAKQLSAMTCAKGESDLTDGVRVLAKTNDKGAQVKTYLLKHGGRVNSCHGNIVSLIMPYEALRGLAKLDSVSYIEASRAMYPSNDVAADNEVGTHLAAMLAHCPNYTGKGVVVGVVDSGIDTTLDAFKDEEGNSRISYFWNMDANDTTRYPTVVTPEGESRTYDYGAEYTAADIDAQTEEEPICVDKVGHGTHVSGTIGGRDAKYPGMAPEVQYIAVALPNDTARLEDLWTGAGSGASLDALEYMLSRAKEMDMPLVVNMSLGSNMGPHDGSTLFEQAIQADIDERNLIICISAGNDHDSNKSAEVTIPAGGSETVKIDMYPYSEYEDDSLYSAVDIWSIGNPKLDMKLELDGSERTIAYEESIEEYEEFSNIQLACTKELASSLNGDDRFLLNFHGPYGLVSKKISVTFTNNSSEDAVVNLYLQRNTDSEFIDHIGGCTVGLPGTTPGAITVGAYASRKAGNYQETVGEISSFSGRGPVRRADLYKGLNEFKPDIVAPGAMLYSMRSTGSAGSGKYVANGGTSMAAPVVTGTVALILQNMPDATPAQIKEILFDKTGSDGFTGSLPNDTYGHGKVNAGCIESSKVVSPQPTVGTAERSSDNKNDLIITGDNFSPLVDVYLNGILWDTDLVIYEGQKMLIIKNVFANNSPLIQDGLIDLQTVKVVNRLAKAGANSDELTISEKSGKDIGSLSSGSGGCFIATAAYGSYLEPEVMTLRRFRDRSLITNAPGRAFVKLYYTYSPAAAEFIAAHPSARWATRVALTPLVYSVNNPGAALTLALMLGLGGCAIYRRRKMEKAS
ncbi:MAG: S8 family serine peptidase [bacterium]|nr:S8 family serine peptidase [bacterium]